MSSHVRSFVSFREVKHKFDKYNESVLQIDDKYRVGGIEVSQSLINSYIKKIKDETGKNVRQMFSDMEIAEQLVKYVAANKLDVDKIPAAALLGGEIPMDDDDIIDEPTSDVVDQEGITPEVIEEPGQPTSEVNPEGVEGSEPNNDVDVQSEVPVEPEQDNEELPTDFEEPTLDETPVENTEDNVEETENTEDNENEEESETDEDKEEGNEELPI